MDSKPLVWVGSALDDLRAFPEDARRKIGYQLRRVQLGLMPDDWKAMASFGQGVYEMRIHTELEHRVLYLAKHNEAIYVLHAFEKRTMQTRQADIDLAKRRLAEVRRGRQSREE
jgi:phage-related protein